MKRIITLFTALLFGISVFAQTTGGPDAYGYIWKNSNHTVSPPTYQWYDISIIGNQVTGLGDDNVVGPFDISSGWPYYWYPVTKLWIGSNGYISFNNDNIASPFPTAIPLPAGANNWVAPFMADLNFGGAGNPAKCYYLQNADTICISWVDVPFWLAGATPYTGSNSFQVIFSKKDSSITFNYKTMNLGSVTTVDAAVGIENITGNIGLQCMLDVLPANSFSIKFYYPPVVTYAVTDGGVNWLDNERTGGIFVQTQGPALTLTGNIKNYGNQNLGSFTVLDSVRNISNVAVSVGSTTVGMLGAQQDTFVTFPNTFTAPVAGTYTYSSSVTGITGDMVASNNKRQMEIIAVDTGYPLITLDYSDGVSSGGLGWNGGDGGIAIYIEPPVKPYRILSSRFLITANAATPVGFHAMIYDDNGISGAPGTLLDSVYVSPASILLNSYITIPTFNMNLVLPDGGVYLVWLMDDAGINLGRDNTPPISNRTYEVLSGAWANYRDMLVEDFLMGINVQHAVPDADFTVDTINDPAVQFIDMSGNYPTAWFWDFDDNFTTSTLKNPIHTFSVSGNFNVCLKAYNAGGKDSICKVVHVSKGKPIANYSFNSANTPTYAFTDLSSGMPTAWKWDFSDIGNDSSSVQNPVYTFKTNGVHTVCLTASNAAGTSAPYCQMIVITTVGMDEGQGKENILVYPNPASGMATVQLNGNTYKNIRIRCFNMMGEKVVSNYSVIGSQIEINTSNLPQGTYFFQVYDGEDLVGEGKMMVK